MWNYLLMRKCKSVAMATRAAPYLIKAERPWKPDTSCLDSAKDASQ